MGAYATELGQAATGAADLGADVGPHLRGEGTQLLDATPAVGDGLQGWGRQRSLTAVVEIGFVGQCWAVVAHAEVSAQWLNGSNHFGNANPWVGCGQVI